MLIGNLLVASGAVSPGYPAGVVLRIAVAPAQIGPNPRSSSRPSARNSGPVSDDVRNMLIATATGVNRRYLLHPGAVAPLERVVPQRRSAAEMLAGAAVRRPLLSATRGIVPSPSAARPSAGSSRRLLRRDDVTPTIVDLNLDTVRATARGGSRQPSTATRDTGTHGERGRAQRRGEHPPSVAWNWRGAGGHDGSRVESVDPHPRAYGGDS